MGERRKGARELYPVGMITWVGLPVDSRESMGRLPVDSRASTGSPTQVGELLWFPKRNAQFYRNCYDSLGKTHGSS